MTTRRSFLRNLIAAVVLAPVVAKFAEAMPTPVPAIPMGMGFDPVFEGDDGSLWRVRFENASQPLHPEFGYAFVVKHTSDGMPASTH